MDSLSLSYPERCFNLSLQAAEYLAHRVPVFKEQETARGFPRLESANVNYSGDTVNTNYFLALALP